MRAADILDSLLAPQVRRVAQRLGLSTSGMCKAEMVSNLARSLASRRGPNGKVLGWYGGMELLLDNLQTEELLEAIDGEWFGSDDRVFETTDAALRRLSDDALRDLLKDLALAEDEDVCTTVTHLATTKWRGVFEEIVFDADDESDDLDVDEDAVERPREPWRYLPVLEVVAGAPLPGGLLAPQRREFRHQNEALEKLDFWYRTGEPAGVLCMPTGSGKTLTAATFVARTAARPTNTILWLAHREELVDQAVATLAQQAGLRPYPRPIRIGRFQAGARKVSGPADIVVASVPTLAREHNLRRLLNEQMPIRLVVVDECHHAVARTWSKLLRALRGRTGVQLLGLSATPTRTAEDERGALWRVFSRVVYEAQAIELMRAGVLAEPQFTFVATRKEFRATAKERKLYERFKDLPPSLISKIVNAPGRSDQVVEHYCNGGPTKFGPTAIFAARTSQAEELGALLLRRGIKAKVVSETSSAEERLAALNGFRDGSVPVLVNVNLFAEGTDLPNVSSVFIARPTRSPILFAQMVGRGMRGPAVGGTRSCQVVVFHDDVQGLAAGQLATSYTDQRDALVEMGLASPTESKVAAPDEAPLSSRAQANIEQVPTRDPAALQHRMKALLAVLAQGSPLGIPGDAVTMALLGWWQLDAEGRRSYLPVFAQDEGVLQSIMVGVRAHITNGTQRPRLPESTCLPNDFVQRFIDKASQLHVAPQYVRMEDAPRGELQEFARGVLLDVGATAMPTHVVEPTPTAPARMHTAPMAQAAPASPEGSGRSVRGHQVQTIPVAVQPELRPDRRAELRGVFETAARVPREHRREWFEQVHARRFSQQYATVVDFMVDVMDAGG